MNIVKTKPKTSDLMLALSCFMITAFTIADMVLQYKTGMEVSDTLVTLWFGFWTCEIFALAGIKVSKVVKNTDGAATDSTSSDDDAVG